MENVHFSLEALKKRLEGKTVKFLVDNQSAVSIIQNGSMKGMKGVHGE